MIKKITWHNMAAPEFHSSVFNDTILDVNHKMIQAHILARMFYLLPWQC